MNEQELRSLVERMVLELAGQPNAAAPAKAAPVTAAAAAGGCLDDITETDLRRQYLVKNPRNGPAFLDLKLRTPARLGLGRAGARYQTLSMLRMRADHAAAQDSVFSHVDDAFVEKNGFVPVQTLCQNKDEYLTRPDRGRRFDEANQAIIKKTLGQNPKWFWRWGTACPLPPSRPTRWTASRRPGRDSRPMAWRAARCSSSNTAGWAPPTTSGS